MRSCKLGWSRFWNGYRCERGTPVELPMLIQKQHRQSGNICHVSYHEMDRSFDGFNMDVGDFCT